MNIIFPQRHGDDSHQGGLQRAAIVLYLDDFPQGVWHRGLHCTVPECHTVCRLSSICNLKVLGESARRRQRGQEERRRTAGKRTAGWSRCSCWFSPYSQTMRLRAAFEDIYQSGAQKTGPVDIAAIRSTRGMSDKQWASGRLAALARVLYVYGFGSDLAAQCVMARLRDQDQPDTMLMNEWGLFYEETTASSLVKVRFGNGTPPEGLHVGPNGTESPSKPDVVNIGCVPVGRAIFDARRDVNSIIHAHPHAVMAVASTEPGLLPSRKLPSSCTAKSDATSTTSATRVSSKMRLPTNSRAASAL